MVKNNNNIKLELKASAFKLNHQFHLVDSRPLPFITAFWVTWVVLLFIFRWHPDYAPYAFMLRNSVVHSSVIMFFLILCYWFVEVVKESGLGHHTLVVQNGLRLGMILFIVSEIMFFFAFFHFSLAPAIALGCVWPPITILIFFIFFIRQNIVKLIKDNNEFILVFFIIIFYFINSSELVNLNQTSVFLLFSPLIKIQTKVNLIKTSFKDGQVLNDVLNWLEILIRNDLSNFTRYFEDLLCYDSNNRIDLIATVGNLLTFKNISFFFYFYTIWLNLKSIIWIWIFDNSKLIEYCYNNTKPGLPIDEIGYTFNESIFLQVTFIFFHFIFLYLLLHYRLTQSYISILIFIPHVVIFYIILLEEVSGIFFLSSMPGFLIIMVFAFFNKDFTFIDYIPSSAIILLFFTVVFILLSCISIVCNFITATAIWKSIKFNIKNFTCYFYDWYKNWSIRKDLEDFYCYAKTLICFYPDNDRLNIGSTLKNIFTFKNISFSFYFYVFFVNLKFSVWLCFFAEAGAGILGIPLIDKVIQFSFIFIHSIILYFLLYRKITKLKSNIFFFILHIFLYFIVLKQIQWEILALALTIEIIFNKSYITISEAYSSFSLFPVAHCAGTGESMSGLQKDSDDSKADCANQYLIYYKKLQEFSSCDQQQKILEAPYKNANNVPHIPRGVGGRKGNIIKTVVYGADLGISNSDKISAAAKWTAFGCNSKWEELLKAQEGYNQCISKIKK